MTINRPGAFSFIPQPLENCFVIIGYISCSYGNQQLPTSSYHAFVNTSQKSPMLTKRTKNSPFNGWTLSRVSPSL